MMPPDRARVSIGLPVFNGERYIEAAIRSILAQTNLDFELLISDNASVDRTEEISRGYAATDSRVRYHRTKENRGSSWNHNRVLELASGIYFKWASHDDVLAPEFLERCVRVLDRDPSVVLCHSKVKVINESGSVLGSLDSSVDAARLFQAHERFRGLILHDRYCVEFFGLMRTDVCKKIQFGSYIGSDRILRAELGLHGRFYEIPEYLFFSRDHPDRSTRAMPAHHLRGAWFDPANAGRKVYPHWRILTEYFRCVGRASLSRYERARCYLHLVSWIGVSLNWARLIADVIIAVRPSTWTWFYKVSRSGETWLKLS